MVYHAHTLQAGSADFSLGQEGCRNDALSLMAPSCCNMSPLSTHMGPFPIKFHELLEKIFGSWSLIRSWTESILDQVLVLNPDLVLHRVLVLEAGRGGRQADGWAMLF